ncbi:MAG TPA: ribbon-helix-helix domain-containing protein [Polyangiaceae bacterium]|nr:ribbon-helix-helix domain-containing protein [Polyangiaceae bacterium]
MKSSLIVKRSIVVAGHKTSVTLEDAYWKSVKEIASGRNMTVSSLVTAVDSERPQSNLSSAIRLFVLDFYRDLADVEGATMTDVETALANCRALINQIKAGLSAKEPFVDVSSATELLFYIERAASALKRSMSRSRERGETKTVLNYH